MKTNEIKARRLNRRRMQIRKKISGTSEKGRLTVFKSLNHIYVQIIDDVTGVTLAASSTLDKEVKSLIEPKTPKIQKSKLVGNSIARKAKEKGITTVVFDRNGYLYHGRIKALAEAAREGGLLF